MFRRSNLRRLFNIRTWRKVKNWLQKFIPKIVRINIPWNAKMKGTQRSFCLYVSLVAGCIFFMRGKSLISLPMTVHRVVLQGNLFKISINICKEKVGQVVLGGLLTSSARWVFLKFLKELIGHKASSYRVPTVHLLAVPYVSGCTCL